MSISVPTFSIVVPTHQRPKQLSACLAALARLDYPRDRFEVIVVHDGAWPDPRNSLPPGEALNVKVLSQLRAGPAAARNKGAKEAKGQLLAFTDDDCAPAPDWLKVLADQLVYEPHAVIGGRTVNGLKKNPYAAASQLVVQTVYSHFNGDYGGRFFASNNLALATKAFHEIATDAAREDLRPVLEYVQEGWQPGDSLYIFNEAQYALRYYAQCDGCRLVEDGAEERTLWGLLSFTQSDPTKFMPAVESRPPDIVIGVRVNDETRIRSDFVALTGESRVWIIGSHIRSPETRGRYRETLAYLESVGVRRDEYLASGAAAFLYDLNAS